MNEEGKQFAFKGYYTAKEWTDLMEKTLFFINKNTSSLRQEWFAEIERPVLPHGFGHGNKNVFVFVFKGAFLPSYNHDGMFWKPSQGTKTNGLFCKRYFYSADEKGLKLKRQVTWMKNNPEYQIVEYRVAHHQEKTCSWEIDYPSFINLPSLLEEVLRLPEIKLTEDEWTRAVDESDTLGTLVGIDPIILSEDQFNGYFQDDFGEIKFDMSE